MASALLEAFWDVGDPLPAPVEVVGAFARRFPYPYKALFAICSDLDETSNRQVYWETMRFLNTTDTTGIGPGVGLEVGNTIYFDMPPGQFSYWNTDDAGRAMVQALVRSGHIDCLHSFGDLATTRSHAGRALDELSRYGCRLETWVDHAVAPSNFGADIMKGRGDLPGSEVFHADLTCGFGIKYVWRGRVTSVIGQDAPRTLRGIYSARHPVASANSVAKELIKGSLSVHREKYAMHGPNEVLRDTSLCSGHQVIEFIRCNPHWGGVSRGDTADGLSEVLTKPVLDRLVAREGVCVLYTHLGKVPSSRKPFGSRAQNALRLLAEYAREGKILVTTTRRLLGYCRARREIAISSTTENGCTRIDLEVAASTFRPSLAFQDFAGICMYAPDPSRTRVRVNGREVMGLLRNPPDHCGRQSVSIPWRALEFPAL